MNDNENGVVWVFFGYLFSFSSLLAGYVVASQMLDLPVFNPEMGMSEFDRIQSSIKRYKSLLTAGSIFTACAWVVILAQVFWFKVHGKVFFTITFIWGGVYLWLSPKAAILIVPVLIYLVIKRDRILYPEKYEEPVISAADRMKAFEKK